VKHGRIGGLKGDRLVAMPMVADIGREVWGVEEARAAIDQLLGGATSD